MKYEIIYIDPPWSYGAKMKIGGSIKKASDAYPTMTEKELNEFPITDFAADDCLLFMWVTSPHLECAMRVAKHWGFTYSTVGFVWDKRHINPGMYTCSQIEMVLIFKKGKIPSPRGSRNVFQFLQETRTEHSKKPSEIRNRIAEMFPTQKKIEIFARNSSPGWDTFGNEASKFDIEDSPLLVM